ncbi:MAG: OmpH family outer membrane protein [Bacteroidales bacterium]|nr:OmpH family outer membrane protein [Bacteroidales bacterium]
MEIIKKMEENKLDESSVTFEATEMANATAESRPTPESPAPVCDCNEEKKCKCKCLPIVNCILLVGLILLYIFHFTGIGAKSGKGQSNANANANVAVSEGGIRIAYVNTDTLMAKYQYAIELKQKLEQASEKQASFAKQEEQLQAELQNYQKNADNLTLAQQQEKERDLKARYEKLARLEQQYASTLPQEQKKLQEESDKMTNAVYNFIREYNEANQQFDYILSKSFTSSPILYGKEVLDITDEIVKGLNDEYEKVKAGKK